MRPYLPLAIVCILCGGLSAAPPTLTSLFPAGGQVGTTVEVTATGNFDKWPVEAWASEKSISVKAGKDKGKFSVNIAADAKPGIVWLRLHDSSGASVLRPFLVGVLPEILEAEPNDETTKPQAIERSCVVNGKLAKSGDVDLFAMKLKQGQTLVASLDAHHKLRSPMDPILQVVSADGFVLEQNHDHHGLDPQLTYTAPKDGTYLVRLFAFPSQPDSSIRFFGSDVCVYRLTLTTAGFADHPIPLAKQKDAKIENVGWNLGLSPLVPSEIAVREESHVCFDFTKVKPTEALVPPFTLTGCVKESHATNSFPMKVTKGKPITIQIESRTLELPLTPVLRVVDPEGKVLSRAEPAKPNADCELTFTPTKDETVKLEVRDLFHDGGPRFVYRLRAVSQEPDIDATVANDRFALTPGTPLEVPLTATTKGNLLSLLTADYEVKADGLPSAVKMELVPGNPKATDAKEKAARLKFTTEAKNLSTAFRLNVVAKLKSGSTLTRPVRTALADFETNTPHFWLTVGEDAKVAPPVPKKKK